MDMTTKAQMLSGMVSDGAPVSEDTLTTYLIAAEYAILNRMYPFGYKDDATVPKRYEMLQLDIAAYLINKQGMEGETSHVENGITRSFSNAGIPEDYLKQITPTGVVW